jgi:hypothetical protein
MATKIQMRTCIFLGYNLTNEIERLTEPQAAMMRNWDNSKEELQLAFDHYSGDFLYAGKELVGIDSEEEINSPLPAASTITNEMDNIQKLFAEKLPQWNSYAEAKPQLYFLNYVTEVIQ